jgi:UDP-N-acetylmuramate dehydrogenase
MKFLRNISLKKFSNFRIGGKAKYFFEAKNISEIKKALILAKKLKTKIFILGGGTNILFNDSGFDGLVLVPKIKFIRKINKNIIRVGAGVEVKDFLNFLVKNELSGLEWAGGLPGTIGGAVLGNAGAFGGEIKDNLVQVKSIEINTLKEKIRNNKECLFDYRFSVFKNKNVNEIILWADFKFKKGKKEKILKSINEKINYRKERHPIEYPNIGSIFKNVPVENFKKEFIEYFKNKNIIKIDPKPVVPMAFLISECGLKNKKVKDAMISPKHPNFIINLGKAEAKDVKKLINLIQKSVKQKFDTLPLTEIIEV